MTTEYLDIVVQQRGAESSGKEIERVGVKSRQTANSVQFLQRALGALAAAFAVKELVNYLDAMQQIQNRLKLVTESTSELARVQQSLLDISNSTKTSFSSTVTFYSRLAAATENLNLSEQRLLQVTKALQQSFVISGSNSQEVAAAAVQLAQGLASGRFQGDELRSVLEANSRFGTLLAKTLGVTRGALRDLGAEGKITADVVVRALTNGAAELNAEAAKLTPTIDQGIQVLKNNLTLAIGQINAATGASKLLGAGLKGVGDILPQIAANALGTFNALRVTAEQFVGVIKEGAGPALEELANFFPFLQASAGNVFAFIRDAIFQLPVNIRAAIRIMIAELDVFAQGAKGFLANVFADLFGGLSSAAESLGLDSVANFLKEISTSFGNVADDANKTKELRRQTADDFIAQTLRERQASQQQFQERLAQLQALQAASLKAAALPPLPGVTPGLVTGAPGQGGAPTPGAPAGGGDLGPAVTLKDINQAQKSGAFEGQTSFGQSFGAPPVQGGTPVNINFGNGTQATVFTDNSTAARLRLGFEDEARKGGSY